MALCENCICYDSCKDWAEQYNDIEFPYGYCTCYKPKDRFIELPCAVGDTVWLICFEEICEAIVVRIEFNYYTNPKEWLVVEFYSKAIGFHEHKSRIDLMLGKTVFLTKEEAEKALAERSKRNDDE